MDKIKLSAVAYACNQKDSGRGKDAFSVFFNDENSGIIAVYSGKSTSEQPFFQNRTNANVSSIISAYVTDKFYSQKKFLFDGTDSQRLCTDLKKVFKRIRHKSEIKNSEPLSASCAVVALNIEEETVECELLWAGNSRIYILDRFGLHQLSKDDCKLGDDFENALNGSEQINFHINEMKINITEPCVVVTATDGAYSGISMPAEFEYKILSSLYYADSTEMWQDKLQSALNNTDCSVAMAILGFETFSSLWQYFSSRYENLLKMFIEPCKNSDPDGLRSLWNEYRKTYLGNGDIQ